MRNIRLLPIKAIAIIAAILIVAGCGLSGPSMHPTITLKQAEQRVHRYVMDAMSAIGMGRLEQVSVDTRECTDPTDGGPQGRAQASEGYFIRDVPVEQNAQVFQNFLKWLEQNNFRVLKDEQTPERFLWAENDEDSFRMTLMESADGNQVLSITAVSPCVWPNGTPELTS